MNFGGYYDKAFTNNNLIFLIGSGQNAGLNYYELTNDNNLKVAGYLNIQDWSIGNNPDINHISFWSNYVAVSTASLGLQIFNLTNQNNPQFTAKINITGQVYSSYYTNNKLIIYTANGSSVYDVTDPSSPSLIGQNGNLTNSVNYEIQNKLIAMTANGYKIICTQLAHEHECLM